MLEEFSKNVKDLKNKFDIDFLDDAIALATEIETLAADGELTLDEIDAILATVKANAEAIKQTIIDSFTKEEKKAIEDEIAAEREEAEENIGKDKDYQEDLKNAEETAKQELADKKAQKEAEKALKDAEKEEKKNS